MVAVYPSLLWQTLKILALLAALAASTHAAEILHADLSVPSTSGDRVKPFAPQPERKALLLVFISHDCPIANSYAPELQRIAREYAARGLKTYLVHTDATLTAADAAKHAKEFGYELPVLLDGDCKLALASGATITPEAALYDGANTLKYLGRIDDRYLDYRKKRAEPTRRDLREALEETLAGKAVSVPRAEAVGCFIPVPSNAAPQKAKVIEGADK